MQRALLHEPIDEARMQVDIAVDPIDGTRLLAMGQPNSIATARPDAPSRRASSRLRRPRARHWWASGAAALGQEQQPGDLIRPAGEFLLADTTSG